MPPPWLSTRPAQVEDFCPPLRWAHLGLNRSDAVAHDLSLKACGAVDVSQRLAPVTQRDPDAEPVRPRAGDAGDDPPLAQGSGHPIGLVLCHGPIVQGQPGSTLGGDYSCDQERLPPRFIGPTISELRGSQSSRRRQRR